MEHVFWRIGHRLILKDITKGEGCYIYDSNKKKYLDLEAGVWCTPLGHSHPKIIQAIKQQVKKISHTGYCYANPVTEEASKAILRVCNLPDGECVFLSSGSEAVEFGVKAIRTITGKPLLLTFSDSFLGSYGSAGEKRKGEWHLFDWSPCADCPHSSVCDPYCQFLSVIPFDKIGGFIFEPGSSSGMVRFPPKSLIQNIVELVKQHSGFVQVNEITTGLGRTGKWFGFQHYDFQPDIISMGKGLGNGYPVSAIAMSSTITKEMDRISFYYQQSHQNDPLGCAVVKEVVAVLNDENLIAETEKKGAYFFAKLLQLKEKYTKIQEVRSRGLMIAIEFAQTVNEKSLLDLLQQCLERGFIIAKRPGLNVIRIDPPLIIERDEIDRFLKVFDQVLGEL